MGYIIISMPNQENAVRIKNVIKSSGFWDDVIICRRGREVLELINEQDIRLVICMKFLADMGYEELVSYLPGNVAVLLLTKDAALVPFAANVTKLLMPFRSESLVGTLRTLLVRERKQPKKRFRTPEEQAAIDQAKQILMDRKGLTEPEAYRYLQKISMDTQRSFLETAQMILLWKE